MDSGFTSVGGGLLTTRRLIRKEAWGVELGDDGILHSSIRLFLRQRKGTLGDDRLFGTLGQPEGSRSLLHLPLEGELVVFSPEGSLLVQPGSMLPTLRGHAHHKRWEGNLTTLHLEWEPGALAHESLEPSTPVALSPRAYQQIRSLFLPVLAQGFERATAPSLLIELLSILRAEGLPFEQVEPEFLEEEVSPHEIALSRLLDWAFTSLEHQPRTVDLESSLGWSRWHVYQRTRSFLERYAFNLQGWREMIHGWRLGTGALLMSARGATTEAVAKEVGYGSPGAFCDALADASLPSPSELRSIVRQL